MLSTSSKNPGSVLGLDTAPPVHSLNPMQDTPRPIPPKLEAKLATLSRGELIEEIRLLYRMMADVSHPRPKDQICAYCGEATSCRPQKVEDGVFPPCCEVCAGMGLWDPIPFAECPEHILKEASP